MITTIIAVIPNIHVTHASIYTFWGSIFSFRPKYWPSSDTRPSRIQSPRQWRQNSCLSTSSQTWPSAAHIASAQQRDQCVYVRERKKHMKRSNRTANNGAACFELAVIAIPVGRWCFWWHCHPTRESYNTEQREGWEISERERERGESTVIHHELCGNVPSVQLVPVLPTLPSPSRSTAHSPGNIVMNNIMQRATQPCMKVMQQMKLVYTHWVRDLESWRPWDCSVPSALLQGSRTNEVTHFEQEELLPETRVPLGRILSLWQ